MTPRLRTSLRFALLSLLALFAGPAFAQGETCSASLLNRTSTVYEDGAFSLSGVPSEDGFFRTRVACEGPDGTRRGQSALFEMQPGLDPNDPDDAFDDPDGDGLSNLQEFEAGTDIYVSDTDADGTKADADAWMTRAQAWLKEKNLGAVIIRYVHPDPDSIPGGPNTLKKHIEDRLKLINKKIQDFVPFKQVDSKPGPLGE